MQDLVHWPNATRRSSSAGFLPDGTSHEESWWLGCSIWHWACSSLLPASPAELGAKVPCSRQKRKQECICMLQLHPASTKLPADEHRRISCLFPNLWQQKQGGKGEGE